MKSNIKMLTQIIQIFQARYTSWRYMLTTVLILVTVEVIINISWLIYNPPDTKEICESNTDFSLKICKGMENFSYIVGFLYPIILICVCTVYAIQTRKVIIFIKKK